MWFSFENSLGAAAAVAGAELESLRCSFPSELPVMQSEALPEQGLRFSMFSSKHVMESDLSEEKGGEKAKIKPPLKHKHLILVLCLS